jgi:BASS family bile acid:Na+ symporter
VSLAAFINVLTLVGLVAAMSAIGLSVPLTEVIAAARQIRLVVFALAANFVFVPLVTLGLLWLFKPEPLVGAGFLILAVCPGAPVGPLFAGIAKADVPSAIGLMVILAGLSAILSPLLLAALLGSFVQQSEVHVNYFSIVKTLAITQILPLAIGLAIRNRMPKFAAQIVRPLNVLGNLLLLAVVVLLLASQWQTLYSIHMQGWIGMLLLLAASLAIGWACGGPRPVTRATLALTTAVRNAGVGLVIVATSFAGTAAGTAVVAYSLVSIFGTLGCAYLYGTRR